MSTTHRAACYRAIHDVFRPHIVKHIRQCFRSHFAAAPAAPLVQLLKSEFDKIKELDERREESAQTDSIAQDEFDLIDVNHLHNVFEYHFDRLVPAGPNGRLPDKRTLLDYIRIITDYRNQIAHPKTQDFSFEDAFRCLDTLRRLLQTIDLVAAAEDIRIISKSLERHSGSLLSDVLREPLINNLPAPETVVTDFVGRKAELAQLWEWFEKPDRRRWALCGEGGRGKSSIAYQFARDLLDRPPKSLRCVFWLSAKKRQFIEASIVAIRNPGFHDLGSALDLLALEYGKEKLLDLPLKAKRDGVLRLLTKAPALIIADDIDSIEKENDSEVIEFLLNDVATVRSRTKVLFTSRRELFGMSAYRTLVRGLDGEDARSFIESRAKRFGMKSQMLKESTIKKIVQVTEGSPLYLEDVLRLMQFVGDEAIKLWEDEKGDTARRFALKREFDMLGEDAQNIVIAACIQPSAISALEAKTILRLSDESFESAVEQLHGLFLIQKPSLVKGEMRYEVNTNLRRLVLKEFSKTDQVARIKKAYAANANQLTSKGKDEIRSIVRQAGLMARSGAMTDAERLLLKAMEKHGRLSILVSELGWVYSNWRPTRATDARQAFRESTARQSNSPDPYIKWCRLEMHTKEFTKAIEVAEKGLNLFQKSFDLTQLAGLASGEKANELLRYSMTESARTALDRSNHYYWVALDLPHPSDKSERELDAPIFRGLLRNYEHTNDIERIHAVFATWAERHPLDPTMDLEYYRFIGKWSDEGTARRSAVKSLQSTFGNTMRASIQ